MVKSSFVPVREAEPDEHALSWEVRELRARLERLEQVSLGAWGQDRRVPAPPQHPKASFSS